MNLTKIYDYIKKGLKNFTGNEEVLKKLEELFSKIEKDPNLQNELNISNNQNNNQFLNNGISPELYIKERDEKDKYKKKYEDLKKIYEEIEKNINEDEELLREIDKDKFFKKLDEIRDLEELLIAITLLNELRVREEEFDNVRIVSFVSYLNLYGQITDEIIQQGSSNWFYHGFKFKSQEIKRHFLKLLEEYNGL